ncbi:hypothetical protein [Agromyces sp. NPDC049794]|uniref:hypothetical protein n=1 Tax=unclassified Agromyces TaxID=2639701 RepID=UPI0033D2E776
MPVSVRAAAYLEIGLAALGFLLLCTTLVFFDWNAYIADTVGPYEHHGAELEVTPAGAIATVVTGLALSFAGVLLSVTFAFVALRGANWARIWITVLFGLGVIAQFASPIDFISVASGLLESVAVILLWLPSSSAFFRSVKLDRAAHRSKRLA